jgi:phospholipase/carboxylesterase
VPTVIDTDLVNFQDWTLRVRPASHGAPRLLLLLHGFTGDENSMWVFMRNFRQEYWMIAPRGLHRAKTGYTWRPPRGESPEPPAAAQSERPGLEDFRPAAEALLSLVDAYASANEIAAAQFDVIGFSQGAALAAVLALLHPERIRRAGVLAGFMPAGTESLIAGRPLSGKPFFVAHGTRDEKVGIEYARRSVEMLEQAGAAVTYCEDQVGHKLSAGCLRGMEGFFS